MFGLTYHQEWPEDPCEVYNHFRKWDKKLQYRGFKHPVVWVREHQKRGAPHFHGLMFLDQSPWRYGEGLDGRPGIGFAGGPLFEEMRNAWHEVAGYGSHQHFLHGVDLQQPKSWDASSGYLSKYLTKGTDDDDDAPTGRMWGVLRAKSLAPAWESTDLTREQFLQLRRMRRRLTQRATCRHLSRPFRSKIHGGKFLCNQSSVDRYIAYLKGGAA